MQPRRGIVLCLKGDAACHLHATVCAGTALPVLPLHLSAVHLLLRCLCFSSLPCPIPVYIPKIISLFNWFQLNPIQFYPSCRAPGS
jgi:hypothetical protein